MERIKEFTRERKYLVYIDFSGLKSYEEFMAFMERATATLSKYPRQSVYTITNIQNIILDTSIKRLFIPYIERNTPYVKYGAIIGLDGVKKLMVDMMIKITNRKNLIAAMTMEQAIKKMFALG